MSGFTAYTDREHSWKFKQVKWNCRRTNTLLVYASMYLWEGSRSMYGSRPGNPSASSGRLSSTPACKIWPNIRLNCWPKCSNRWACTQTRTKQSVPAYHAKTCHGCKCTHIQPIQFQFYFHWNSSLLSMPVPDYLSSSSTIMYTVLYTSTVQCTYIPPYTNVFAYCGHQ